MHLLFERSSIRARLINRDQRKERDIDAGEIVEVANGVIFRGVAQLTPVHAGRGPSARL